jgi:large subunit ribosomal protein L21
MFAIVEIAGQQFKIDGTTKTLRVPYQVDAEVGKSIDIKNILMTSDAAGKVAMGGKATIGATIQGHVRGEKIIVFHKKRRKGYRKTNGHTPKFTELSIEKFSV